MDKKKNVKFSENMGKIIVSILIVAVIGAIWYFKNSNKTPIVEEDNPSFALNVTDSLDIEKLKSYGLPIMIDFGADSCVPCKEMAPTLVELNKELRLKVIIKFVDVWKYKSLAEGYPISVIPTQVFFDKDGKPFNPKDPDELQMKMYSSKKTDEHLITTHEGGLTKEQFINVFKEMGVE
jgi:thioredoxin 1